MLAASISMLFMLDRENHQKRRLTKPNGINAFMTNVTYIQFDQLGQLHSRLHTPDMEHYVKHDASFFSKPKILIYTADRIPWYITSNYGRSQNGTGKVYLWGNVVLHQPQRENHPETTILTSAITIYPKRYFAVTDRKVTVRRPGSIIKGKGVTANFKTGIIKLLTHSQGTYEAAEKQQ